MSHSGVRVDNVVKTHADHQALRGVSLSVEPGSYTVILGPSGSGKTTLLAILGGFVEPTSGQVSVGGVDVTTMAPSKRPTTTVFQDYALFPHMSVGKNVGFGLEMKNLSKAERTTRVSEALEMVGLGHVEGRAISELSGGQRQRVALARAIVVEPPVLLLDEPLGALDLKLRRSMQDELREIQKKLGTTFIHVTHDQEEAMALADNIVILRDGLIDDMGSPKGLYQRPKTAFSAQFMGDANIVTATVDPENDSLVQTPLGPIAVSQAVSIQQGSVALRPEHVHVGDGGDHSLGEFVVAEVGFFGLHNRVILTRDHHSLVAYTATTTIPEVGEVVRASVNTNDVIFVEGTLQ